MRPPNRTLEPVGAADVTVEDPFWSPRIDVNRSRTLVHQWRMLAETGRLDNLAKAAGRMPGRFRGQRYNDSDVYKWMEAAAYALAQRPDPDLLRNLNSTLEHIEAAQQPDGYLNSYHQLEAPEGRWRNLGMGHELYCAGHLIEAALAHHATTGSERFLAVARRFADLLVRELAEEGNNAIPGHPEIELALLGLGRVTGTDAYRRLALEFLRRRGRRPSRFEQELADPSTPGNRDDYRKLFERDGRYDGGYAQDHCPLAEQRDATGHAVRAMYLHAAMAECVASGEAPELEPALLALWKSVTERRMYVTGGVGSSRENEGFTEDHDLPTKTAYAETCAAIGLVLFCRRMLGARRDLAAEEVMERALYNAALAGASLDGLRFFYSNPLESDGDRERKEWFDCACCPPNLSRLLHSLGRYAYSQDPGGVTVHLYLGGRLKTRRPDGTPFGLVIESRLPWEGEVKLRLELERPLPCALHLRRPRWVGSFAVAVNGAPVESGESGASPLTLRRVWQPGDQVLIHMTLPVLRLRAAPQVRPLEGHVALQRGPLIYCFEEVDLGARPQDLVLPAGRELQPRFEAALLEGVTVLEDPGSKPTLRAVPYYAWANRGPGAMAVWMREAGPA